MSNKIYIASKAKHRPIWRNWRDDRKANIISRWIDTDDKYSIDPSGLDYEKLWGECIEDIFRSDIVIVYVEKDEILKGALVEIGSAIVLNKPIILCGHRETFLDNGTWYNHPNVMYAGKTFWDALKLYS